MRMAEKIKTPLGSSKKAPPVEKEKKTGEQGGGDAIKKTEKRVERVGERRLVQRKFKGVREKGKGLVQGVETEQKKTAGKAETYYAEKVKKSGSGAGNVVRRTRRKERAQSEQYLATKPRGWGKWIAIGKPQKIQAQFKRGKGMWRTVALPRNNRDSSPQTAVKGMRGEGGARRPRKSRKGGGKLDTGIAYNV